MAHITNPEDMDGEITKSTRVIPIDKNDNSSDFEEMRLFLHNQLWKTDYKFPKEFTNLDRTIAMDLLNYGETNWAKPENRVIEWLDMIMENRDK